MIYIQNFEKYNESNISNSTFFHITTKKHLDSLLSGIKTNMAEEWGQGNGLYVFRSEKHAEEQDGVGNNLVDAMIKINVPLNMKNFDIDYEKCYILPKIVEKYIPKIHKIFKNNFIITHKNKKYSIFTNSDDKSSFYFDDKKFRNENITYIKNKNNEKFCYLPIDKNGKLKFEQNIYGAMVIKYCMELLKHIGIYKLIQNDIFNDTDLHKSALRYIGASIKPNSYKLKKDGIWGEWIINTK